MTQINPHTLSLIEKLEEHYGHDQSAMRELGTFRRAPNMIRLYNILRENKIVLKIAQEAKDKMARSTSALLSPTAWKMSDEERVLHSVTREWAIWFLTALGDDPEEQLLAIDREVEMLAKRAGLVPKE